MILSGMFRLIMFCAAGWPFCDDCPRLDRMEVNEDEKDKYDEQPVNLIVKDHSEQLRLIIINALTDGSRGVTTNPI